ncbi:MAG: hypothetical protein ACRC1P_02190 [Cellulosilyticaceae bacterium]
MINQLRILSGVIMLVVGMSPGMDKVNQPPEVVKVYTTQKSYKAGEPIELGYFYSNEKGESIEESWTYRKLGEPIKCNLYTKPEIIFKEGEYLVTLKLTDEKGNIGESSACIIKIKGQPFYSEYEYKFGKVPIGVTIDNFEEINFREYENLNVVENRAQEGVLVMSNSPESVKEEGILYEEVVKGKGRLLVHHINHIKEENKRLVVLAQNKSSKRVDFTIKNKIFRGPSKDVLAIGQRVLYDYFNKGNGVHVNLMPEETYIIYDSLKDKWKYDEVISGMVDFEGEGCIKYIVASINQETQIEQVPNMSLAKRDVHPRGTFEHLAKYYNIKLDKVDQNTKVVIGGTEAEWERGKDTLTQKNSINRGNFGVTYHLRITAEQDTAVILNPRGNMFRGAIEWEGEGAYLVPKYGYFPSLEKAAYLGIIKKGETKELVYMLPCGSSAPIVIGFIPETQWQNKMSKN